MTELITIVTPLTPAQVVIIETETLFELVPDH